MASTWITYNELAWTNDWLAEPADYEDEAMVYVDLIRRAAAEPPRTLLHMGSGAGGHDRVFKKHFSVTGVDLSPGMLTLARLAHADLEYIEGDMRTVHLQRQFDAVAIPDSIDYMATQDDLRQAVYTAAAHLKHGGVLLVAAKTKETFQNNNFAYAGEKDGIHVTLLENNHVDPLRPDTYEAVVVYLIRRGRELSMHTEQHVLGLFSRATWQQVFHDAGLAMQEKHLDGVYDRYLLGDGRYPLTLFVGRKVGREGNR